MCIRDRNMALNDAGVAVRGILVTSEELETYFLNLTGGESSAKAY